MACGSRISWPAPPFSVRYSRVLVPGIGTTHWPCAVIRASATRAVAPQLYRRYRTMFLDGIRADQRPLTPLPLPALTTHETHTVMTRKRGVSNRGELEHHSQAAADPAADRPMRYPA
jgi:hypothetical protein